MTSVKVNAASLAQLLTNADPTRARALMGQLSGGSNDGNALHDIFADFGYPEVIRFDYLWNMYRRFGIARAVVDLPVAEGWRELPEIEASAQFLSDFEKLSERTKFWQRMKALDTRQRVGRYAGLIMRIKDGKQSHEPFEGGAFGESSLVSMLPVYEGELEVHETDQDPTSDNFGQPSMYTYKADAPSNRNERTNARIKIHPSRVIVAAEGADNGSIYGIPALEGCFNSLIDLRKIIGSGGEGFYRNAAQSLVFTLRDTAEIDDVGPLLADFNDQADDFTRNRMRRSLWTPNMDAQTLDSNLSSPKDHFAAALADVSASSNIATTILIGNQQGRLASSEDGRRFLRLVQSRRLGFQNDTLMQVLNWLIEGGFLPADKYTITWQDAMAPSDDDKLANADKMADINQKSFNSGEGSPFAAEEIREAAGFEPEDLPEPSEELTGDDED